MYVTFTCSLKTLLSQKYQIDWGSILWKAYSFLSYQFQYIIVWKLPLGGSYDGCPFNVYATLNYNYMIGTLVLLPLVQVVSKNSFMLQTVKQQIDKVIRWLHRIS